MNGRSKPARVRQITVAIDTSLRALSVLEIAAPLAVRRQASLEALFVEDINLFALAALPCARELDTASCAERRLDEPQVASGLRTHQWRVRRALEKAGRQRQLRTAVRVRRGHYVAEALQAASGVDVLFLTSVGRVRYSDQVAPRLRHAQAPIWVVYDGSRGAERALQLGVEISQTNAASLDVVLLTEGNSGSVHLTEEVEKTLDRGACSGGRLIALSAPDKLREMLASAGCSLLLLPKERSTLLADPSGGLLEVLSCPLAVVS